MTTELDKVFSALSDANRRRIIDLLKKKDHSLLDLSAHFDISFQAVSKHLKVLEGAKLITREKKGKYVVCSFQAQQLEIAAKWIQEHHEFWNQGFDRLENFLQTTEKTSHGWRIKK